jgi:hypothetical protein
LLIADFAFGVSSVGEGETRSCVLLRDKFADMLCSERAAVGGMGLWRIGILCMVCMKEKSAAQKYLLELIEDSGREASELVLSECQ